jgi:hypothetical protein
MKKMLGYHHFKGTNLPPVGGVERHVVSTILASTVPDEKRENSICWELKHSSGAVQLARLLAQHRGLDESIAAIALALHDIYAIETGLYRDHARLGVPIAERALATFPELTKEQVDLVLRMIGEHSLKEEFTDDPYVELAKDVDVLDCFLYPDVEQYYLTAKPLAICKFYFQRIAQIRRELGLPRYPRYESLKEYAPNWLGQVAHATHDCLPMILSQIFPEGQHNPTTEILGVAAIWGTTETGYQVASNASLSYGSESSNRSDVAAVIGSIPHNENVLLLCWPAFNIYELRQGADAYKRLSEIGILETSQSVP